MWHTKFHTRAKPQAKFEGVGKVKDGNAGTIRSSLMDQNGEGHISLV
jgi:hypothetical protein